MHIPFEVYLSTLGVFGNIKVTGRVDQVLVGTRSGNFAYFEYPQW